MSDRVNQEAASEAAEQDQEIKAMEKIFAAAQPGAVFGQPVVSGSYTVITASEVMAGGGFGHGRGYGPVPQVRTSGEASEGGAQPGQESQLAAGGGGGGGGGGSKGRPVAIVVIGPDGVTVKPVFDLTKIAIVGVTTCAAMLAVFRRMRRAAKG